MIICWWRLSKQTSYWSKTVFFFSVKKVNNICQITVKSSQNNKWKYCTKGHEQVKNRLTFIHFVPPKTNSNLFIKKWSYSDLGLMEFHFTLKFASESSLLILHAFSWHHCESEMTRRWHKLQNLYSLNAAMLW